MAGQINVNKVDTPIMEQTGFDGDMYKWLPDTVDNINSSFELLIDAMALLFAQGLASVGGSGAGPINVTVTGLTASGFVTVQLLTSSNPVTILSVVPGAGQFAITFSADPGATANIVWQAYAAVPQ